MLISSNWARWCVNLWVWVKIDFLSLKKRGVHFDHHLYGFPYNRVKPRIIEMRVALHRLTSPLSLPMKARELRWESRDFRDSNALSICPGLIRDLFGDTSHARIGAIVPETRENCRRERDRGSCGNYHENRIVLAIILFLFIQSSIAAKSHSRCDHPCFLERRLSLHRDSKLVERLVLLLRDGLLLLHLFSLRDQAFQEGLGLGDQLVVLRVDALELSPPFGP